MLDKRLKSLKYKAIRFRIKYNDTYAWMLKKVVTQGNLPNSTILWDGEIGKDTEAIMQQKVQLVQY